jgi:uncharacterized protein YdaU (DUF1376 family)
MANPFPYMRFFVRDYLCDPLVRVMSYVQKGMYTTLLFVCWDETPVGTLPADDVKIAAILEVPLRQWVKNKEEVLAPFSFESDGRWHQKRVEKEYAKLNQPKDSTNAERQRRYRERHSNALRNGDSNALRNDYVSVLNPKEEERGVQRGEEKLPFRPDPNGDKPLVERRLVDHNKLPWTLVGELDNEPLKQALSAWVRDSKAGYTRTQFMVLQLRLQRECKTAKEAMETIEFSLSKRATNLIFPTERFTK